MSVPDGAFLDAGASINQPTDEVAMTMPRFKNRNMEKAYQYALVSHVTLYRETGNAGASHREAYSRGYRGDMSLYSRDSIAHAYYAAGKHNAKNDTSINQPTDNKELSYLPRFP
jgi:hypothetical protein